MRRTLREKRIPNYDYGRVWFDDDDNWHVDADLTNEEMLACSRADAETLVDAHDDEIRRNNRRRMLNKIHSHNHSINEAYDYYDPEYDELSDDYFYDRCHAEAEKAFDAGDMESYDRINSYIKRRLNKNNNIKKVNDSIESFRRNRSKNHSLKEYFDPYGYYGDGTEYGFEAAWGGEPHEDYEEEFDLTEDGLPGYVCYVCLTDNGDSWKSSHAFFKKGKDDIEVSDEKIDKLLNKKGLAESIAASCIEAAINSAPSLDD